METEPKIETRPEQPYLAIRCAVKMEEIPAKLPALIPEIYSWLQAHNIAPAGPVFFNYLDMLDGKLNTEVGVPVHTMQAGDGYVQAGTFPAGKYIVYTYFGSYTGIPQAHRKVEQWAKDHNLKLQNPCIEFYPTDPETLPNQADWQTDILRRISDSQG